MKLAYSALALAAFAVAAPAQAATAVVAGDTTGSPTYNRTLSGSPPTILSAVGTAVAYDVVSFSVGTGGSYSFNLDSLVFDPFLTLYSGSFDPSNPLANALIADDDAGPGSNSAFSFNLASGVSYFAVATGFGNSDFGAYTLTITGPGDILIGAGAVPEPGTWALLILGFGMTGAAMRRRTKMSVSYS